jgi:hypothetical protein
MSKTVSFKGRILFVSGTEDRKMTPLKYAGPNFDEGFEDTLTDSMMVSFEHLKLTNDEKKILSRSHRKMLNYYRHVSPFSLNGDAKKLIAEINQCCDSKIVIEAVHYGAYVCLAALYSGKLDSSKKIEFILEKAPLALFPKNFIKSKSTLAHHKVTFRLSDDCWLSPFSSLYNNDNIKYSLKKAA